MGGYQNYGPFLGTLNIRGRIITGIQKGTIILTTTHIGIITGTNGKENGNYYNGVMQGLGLIGSRVYRIYAVSDLGVIV